jgi:hypothetical protein
MTRPAFTPSAARLAGLAALLFGWRPDDFWRATPEELAGVLAAMAEARGGAAGAAPVDGGTLARLRARFPAVGGGG